MYAFPENIKSAGYSQTVHLHDINPNDAFGVNVQIPMPNRENNYPVPIFGGPQQASQAAQINHDILSSFACSGTSGRYPR